MNFSRLFSLPPHSHESNTLAPHRWCSSQITARVENQRKSDNSDLRELKLKHSLTQVYAKLSVHWSQKWEVGSWELEEKQIESCTRIDPAGMSWLNNRDIAPDSEKTVGDWEGEILQASACQLAQFGTFEENPGRYSLTEILIAAIDRSIAAYICFMHRNFLPRVAKRNMEVLWRLSLTGESGDAPIRVTRPTDRSIGIGAFF